MTDAIMTLLTMLLTMAAIWFVVHMITGNDWIENPRPKCKGKHCKNCLERGEK